MESKTSSFRSLLKVPSDFWDRSDFVDLMDLDVFDFATFGERKSSLDWRFWIEDVL